MKKLVSVLLILFLVINVMPVQSAYAATVKLNKTSITLNAGSSYTLKVTGTTKTVKWSSSDAKIASVSAKGAVKAIKKGSAKITAAVSGKKYTCKVTVNEVFNAKKAVEKISVEEEMDLGDGVVIIVKNNYSFPYYLTATTVFYDEAGKMMYTSSDANYYFEKGKECALYFDGPHNSSYDKVPYASYKITYTARTVLSSQVSTLSDIEVTADISTNNVIAEVTNTGEKEPESTVVSIVFYNGGVPVGYNYRYADVIVPGSTAYVEFSFPYDSDYNTIAVDDYKIFVNYSYYYKD
ncbi:MAG: Ig-like domain-containing protein [Mobilitalea sp.]